MSHKRDVPEEFAEVLQRWREERDLLTPAAERHAMLVRGIEAFEQVYRSYGQPIPPETCQDAPDATEHEAPVSPIEDDFRASTPPRRRAPLVPCPKCERALPKGIGLAHHLKWHERNPDATMAEGLAEANRPGDPASEAVNSATAPDSDGGLSPGSGQSEETRAEPGLKNSGQAPEPDPDLICRFCGGDFGSIAARMSHEQDDCGKRLAERASLMHVHRWLLGSPKNGEVKQTCKGCGTTKFVPADPHDFTGKSWKVQPPR